MNQFTHLARAAIETYLRSNRFIAPPPPLPSQFKKKAGVFVSIYAKTGELRGCIGTIEPQYQNIAYEIIHNAVNSATTDPRFERVTLEELPNLNFCVYILAKPEKIKNKEELEPKRYGLIVECKGRRGLLLPNIEGVETPDQQIEIACQKAWIAPGEPTKMYRFTSKTYKEQK